MIRTAITMAVYFVLAAVPALVGAQAGTAAVAPGRCDCPADDKRGDLRNLAAFAPLGLLGAVAAAGGMPAMFAGGTPDAGLPTGSYPSQSGTGADVVTIDPARNTAVIPDKDVPPPSGGPLEPLLDGPLALRRGVRPPTTATPLPSVLLLGTGLIAIGCVAIIRTRG